MRPRKEVLLLMRNRQLREVKALAVSEPERSMGRLTEVLRRIVSDFESNYLLDGKVVDNPQPCYEDAWRMAKAALAVSEPESGVEREMLKDAAELIQYALWGDLPVKFNVEAHNWLARYRTQAPKGENVNG